MRRQGWAAQAPAWISVPLEQMDLGDMSITVSGPDSPVDGEKVYTADVVLC